MAGQEKCPCRYCGTLSEQEHRFDCVNNPYASETFESADETGTED